MYTGLKICKTDQNMKLSLNISSGEKKLNCNNSNSFFVFRKIHPNLPKIMQLFLSLINKLKTYLIAPSISKVDNKHIKAYIMLSKAHQFAKNLLDPLQTLISDIRLSKYT